VNKPNGLGTPFHVACINDQDAVVALLIKDKRVDINSQKSVKEWTPFYMACYFNSQKVIKILMQDERVDVNKKYDETRMKPLYSRLNGDIQVELLKILIQDNRIDLKPTIKKDSFSTYENQITEISAVVLNEHPILSMAKNKPKNEKFSKKELAEMLLFFSANGSTKAVKEIASVMKNSGLDKKFSLHKLHSTVMGAIDALRKEIETPKLILQFENKLIASGESFWAELEDYSYQSPIIGDWLADLDSTQM
jgi:ankyrin repeat protein